METLEEAKLNLVYQIEKIQTSDSVKKHLQNLGVIIESKIVVINRSGNNSILLLKNNRIAVNRELLSQIIVKKSEFSEESWTSLDQLTTGESGVVVAIHGKGAVKRRLMDMGVTKNVRVTVRKLAPLGDPLEITLRGYELTLRKEEASLILVQKEE
ncbi:ferrous iron transport protein A [Enterococcus durans]|uniref:Ferrous iron transport protein A n=1 Tax=Enterococcus durans TaxID=53345 RepID=A0A5N0YXV9_9ENTE|nr:MULTISPECIES: ferrous iron transport protein A [Enterococcus]KAA9179330.1 ferrous iron transport protein A [Enterococcus durans]KAA9185767.1 ferrous iron transport protein A [Enterococcus durans]KAA9186530.1 ferrous iron transport protein A [Enterococcus durans]KAA9190168.1 ferrous iron transport protein A [Enterococcus durans]KAA9190972.1 ferrous iron transport protein A [Enterococcus durans]